MQTIPKLREQIDKIDEKLIHLLAERFLFVRQIGEQKHMEEKNVVDTERESFILQRMLKIGMASGLSGTSIKNIWTVIFAQSRKEQEKNE